MDSHSKALPDSQQTLSAVNQTSLSQTDSRSDTDHSVLGWQSHKTEGLEREQEAPRQPRNLLVTGACGYRGSHFVAELLTTHASYFEESFDRLVMIDS